MDNTFQLFPCDYNVPCQTHQCFGRGAFFIGKPDQRHTGTLQILCDQCANELRENIKKEIAAPIEHELLPFSDEPVEVIEVDGVDVTTLNVPQLKAVCKDLGLKGYSDKTKDELIELIEAEANQVEA